MRERLAPLRRGVAAAEARLEALTSEKDDVDGSLADPAVYGGPEERVAALSRRQRELEEEITGAEEEWLASQEALEEQLAAEDGETEV